MPGLARPSGAVTPRSWPTASRAVAVLSKGSPPDLQFGKKALPRPPPPGLTRKQHQGEWEFPAFSSVLSKDRHWAEPSGGNSSLGACLCQVPGLSPGQGDRTAVPTADAKGAAPSWRMLLEAPVQAGLAHTLQT